jgi:hypothetical protein
VNQVSCLRAVQYLINNNAATLVSGFTHQGVARTIDNVAISVLVAPSAYYFFAVNIVRADSIAVPNRNIREPAEQCLYKVMVHVADVAMPQSSDPDTYETMAMDFREMCDRFVTVLRATTCFTAPWPADTSKFFLGGTRRVSVINADHWWKDADTGEIGPPILYSTIEFDLEERFAA